MQSRAAIRTCPLAHPIQRSSLSAYTQTQGCYLSYMMMTGGAQRQVKVILVGIGCVLKFLT